MWYVTLGQAVSRRIFDLCKQRGITLNKLATICGITQSTLNNIANGGSNNPKLATIKKICDGLELTLAQFFDDELFDELEQEIE